MYQVSPTTPPYSLPHPHGTYSPLQHVCSHSHYLLIGHCTTPLNNTALLLHLNLLHLFRESGKTLPTSTLDDLKNLMLERQSKIKVQFTHSFKGNLLLYALHEANPFHLFSDKSVLFPLAQLLARPLWESWLNLTSEWAISQVPAQARGEQEYVCQQKMSNRGL